VAVVIDCAACRRIGNGHAANRIFLGADLCSFQDVNHVLVVITQDRFEESDHSTCCSIFPGDYQKPRTPYRHQRFARRVGKLFVVENPSEPSTTPWTK
jgi:hypothetical protein